MSRRTRNWTVLLAAVGALLAGASPPATAASPAETLRKLERARNQALVEADVPTLRRLHAADFMLVNPLGEVLSRDDFVGGVGSGDIDFLALDVLSPIRVRVHGRVAALRYRSRIDIRVAGVGRLTHEAWQTELYERRDGRWQDVWAQTTAIGPLPQPS